MSFKSHIRSRVKRSLLKRGFAVTRISHPEALGNDPFKDMTKLTQAGGRPTVFDVGANCGQSVEKFRGYFASPIIHSFEPGDAAFTELSRNMAAIPDLHLNKMALGSGCERKMFIENEQSDMSSFLEPDEDSWGAIRGHREIDVETVDSYCSRTSVSHIDVLKSDTQGFDYEVFKGARHMFSQHRIHLVYTEIIFSQMYKNLPRFDEIYSLLSDQGLFLVSFYLMHYQNNRAGWTDALFVDPEFRRQP